MPEWLIAIPVNFWAVLGEMAPYLLFGFLMAGVLSVAISPQWVQRHLGGRGLWPVLKASALGVPLPLCSCSVIPVATSIRRHGAGKGATTAFLISTPQTGVDSIFATLALLGPVFAIYRPLAALVSGVLGGAIVSATETDQDADAEQTAREEVCCTGQGTSNPVARSLRYAFVTLPKDIGLTLLVGLAIAALISAAVPKGYFSTIVPPGPLQILVLMVVGVPIYICATASIPVAARLILAGVSPGAAFALLMTGPATNAATVGTIWKVMGKRTCLIYLATMMAAAFAGGLLLDELVTAVDVRKAMEHGWMPDWLKTASAVVLLGVLGAGVLRRAGGQGHSHEPDEGTETLTLTVTGMTCDHCVSSVRGALLACAGVESVEIDLKGGKASVWGGDFDESALVRAVTAAGFTATTETDRTGLDSEAQGGRQ